MVVLLRFLAGSDIGILGVTILYWVGLPPLVAEFSLRASSYKIPLVFSIVIDMPIHTLKHLLELLCGAHNYCVVLHPINHFSLFPAGYSQ